jgi:hypothetical protein
MGDHLIELEWFRDTAGYKLAPEPRRTVEDNPPKPDAVGEGRARIEEKPMRVLRLGGTLHPYQPLQQTLFTIFASDVKEANDVLGFIERFGPLTRDGVNLEIGDSVSNVLIHAKTMRIRLASMAWGKDRSRRLRPTHSKSPRQPMSGSGVVIPIDMDPRRALDVYVDMDCDVATGAVTLKFRPADLLNALWVEFVLQTNSNDIAVRECQHCGVWFIAGGTTGRRIDAKFCSIEHRTLYNSLKRSWDK